MHVDVVNGTVRIGEPDDCTRLDVRVSAADRAQVDRILRAAAIGRSSDTEAAELSVSALRERASAEATAADWTVRWDAMIGYARSKGWLTADGAFVRAHLVDTG